jgi:hypothetical protein
MGEASHPGYRNTRAIDKETCTPAFMRLAGPDRSANRKPGQKVLCKLHGVTGSRMKQIDDGLEPGNRRMRQC